MTVFCTKFGVQFQALQILQEGRLTPHESRFAQDRSRPKPVKYVGCFRQQQRYNPLICNDIEATDNLLMQALLMGKVRAHRLSSCPRWQWFNL